MKRVVYLMMVPALLFSSVLSAYAQNMLGTEFWLTFGQNVNITTPNSSFFDENIDLQVRIVGGASPTTGSIHFTRLGTSINFNIAPEQVYTYNLSSAEKLAVYNTLTDPWSSTIEISNRSIRITSDEPVVVFALNQAFRSADATNILPTTVLGTDYHIMSYSTRYADAYAAIATRNGTRVYHNGILAGTLNAGQVYYRTSGVDMTGAHITANNPIALYALNQGAQIPAGIEFVDCLMQQLAPIETWGRNFFVPVSHRARDIVRIVASQNNTNITQVGGTLLASTGNIANLQTGQYVELRVELSSNGCYIQADKPVGVCAYLTGGRYNEYLFGDTVSDPAQAWLPAIEQTAPYARIAPFIPEGVTALIGHYVLVLTPTATKDNTEVSIGGAPATALSGGSWRDNAAAGMSFYNMPLTNSTASYYFTNQAGIILLCYGVGTRESYYYLGSSAMRNLNAAFYANDIYYQSLLSHTFCTNDITFRAEIEGISPEQGSLKWYIDGVEQIAMEDQLTWSESFPAGEYEIKMTVFYADESSITLESTLNIGVHISTIPLPTEGGTTTGDGCYRLGEPATVTAIPNPEYTFLYWSKDGIEVSTDASYTFTVTDSCSLIAHFGWLYEIIVSANPPEGGTVSGGGAYDHGANATVAAVANEVYNFINWTEGGVQVSIDASYTFTVTESRVLVANFELVAREIIVSANPPEGGTVSGGGIYARGANATVAAVANEFYDFINWTEGGTQVSTDASYTFTVIESRVLVANFGRPVYTVNVGVNNDTYGYTTGSGRYEAYTTAGVEAFGDCYRFINWTIDGVEVSTDNPYEFVVTEDVNIVANFYALDFDTYSPTLWSNTFMLNLRKLAEEGYEVTDCKWFKNGVEEIDTRTIDQFSYSAGPDIFDLLELAPTYYMFRLTTRNHGYLCSTHKLLTGYDVFGKANAGSLFVYPNPVMSGSPFTIEGDIENGTVEVYNQYGVFIGSAVATGSSITFSLHLPAGIYFIRANNKEVKVVII